MRCRPSTRRWPRPRPSRRRTSTRWSSSPPTTSAPGFNIIEKGTFTNAEAATPPANQSGTSSTETPVRPSGGSKDPARSSGIVNGAGSADPKNFAPATFRTADDPAGVVDGSPEASLWVSYLSGNHTGADVPIFTSGPESEYFARRQQNTDLFTTMVAALKALHDSKD